jgi:aspartate 1-decarboxylase
VEIILQTLYVPVEWNKNAEVIKTESILKSTGNQGKIPLYMLHSLREIMKPIDIKANLKSKNAVKIESGKSKNTFIIHPKEIQTQIEINGEMPKDTKNGDVVLVKITANYPKFEKTPAKSVEFLEVLHVTDKKRK